MKWKQIKDFAPNLCQKPLISVIIPVFNPPVNLMKRCIESVMSQTYDAFEIIIVDDGCDQSFKQSLSHLTSNYKQIRVIETNHKGVSHARNVGIREARGEWIAFADVDDQLVPNFFKESLLVALNEECDMVCGSVLPLFVGSDTKATEGGGDVCILQSLEDINMARFQMLCPYKYNFDGIPDFKGRGPVAKLYRKRIISEITFEEGIAIGEDVLFNYRYIERCRTVAIVDRTWYWYYMYNGSATHKASIDPWLSSITRILNSRATDEDRVPFASRCSFLTRQGIAAIATEFGMRKAFRDGVDLLKFASKKKVFDKGSYELYKPTRRVRTYEWFCKKGSFAIAYWYWCLIELLKKSICKKRLFDYE